jgi:hypothetical protein
MMEQANPFYESARRDAEGQRQYPGMLSPTTPQPTGVPLTPVLISSAAISRDDDNWINRQIVGKEITVHIAGGEGEEPVTRKAKVLSLAWTLHVDDEVIGTVELMFDDGETRLVVGTQDLRR